MLGVSLAVAVLMVVLSVFNGFESELQQRILGMASDATLWGLTEPLADWRVTRELALQREDIIEAAPFIEGQGIAVIGEKFAGISVRGIEPRLETGVTTIGEILVEGELDSLASGSFNMVLGSTLAQTLGVGVGDKLMLWLAEANVTPAGLIPRRRSFTVSGIFEAGMYEYDRGLVFVNMEDAGKLFRTDGRASGLNLAVADIYVARRVITDFALDLGGGFSVSDWTRQHANLFRSIQLTRSIFFVILSLVIGVAAFNIVSTLVMVVRDKRGDIAILKSLGASPGSILSVFTGQGTLIGLIGTLFGLALGLGVIAVLEPTVGLIEAWLNIELVSAEVYGLSSLPTEARGMEIGQIALFALVMTIVATIYPALSAARQPPARALRHE